MIDAPFLETLVRESPDPVVILRSNRTIEALNPAFEALAGLPRESWIGQGFAGLLHPEDVAQAHEVFQAALRDERGVTAQLRFTSPDGGYRTGEVSLSPRRHNGRISSVQGIVRDVTEREQVALRLQQAQKMEAVGKLAAGVAHDFNNLLTAILGYGELVATDLEADHPSQADVLEIRRAAERAVALTRQLLAFSRQQVLESRVLDLNDLVVDTERMLGRLVGEDITVTTRLAPGLGRVKVDPGQIEQVLLNLVVNARDAMPGGGKLTIETANVQLDEKYAREHGDVTAGQYVMIAISDNGTGMEADVSTNVAFSDRAAEAGYKLLTGKYFVEELNKLNSDVTRTKSDISALQGAGTGVASSGSIRIYSRMGSPGAGAYPAEQSIPVSQITIPSGATIRQVWYNIDAGGEMRTPTINLQNNGNGVIIIPRDFPNNAPYTFTVTVYAYWTK